ncbi:hypothetical protein M885DRAFT_620244 [Pelagophyceae sp. CCMP2097]|nr:hypothetical protein M885DRAFT_620244 [Pelagophyceae sp. CCMP2097]
MAGVDGAFWGAEDEASAPRAPSAGTTTSLPSIRPSSQSASEKSAPRLLDGDDFEETAMPTQFYTGVDSLLSQPPPSLRAFCRKGAAPARKPRGDARMASGKGKPADRRDAPQAPRAKADLSRVQEALEFGDRLSRQVQEDGALADRAQRNHRREAAEPRRKGQAAEPRQKKRAEARVDTGSARSFDDTHARPPPHESARDSKPSFDTAGGGRPAVRPGGAARARSDDVDDLVRNFESGLGAQELRRQLLESQNSMRASRDVLSEAAREWRGSHG